MDTDEEGAYEDLFRRELPSIVHAAFLVVGDVEAAREIAQDAFTQLFIHWRRVSGYERPGAWVRRVAIRMAVRESGRRPVALPAAGLSSPHDLDVWAAVMALPPKERAAIVLFYFNDLPVADVAAALGCRPSTARVRLHRGRQRLAAVLGEEATTGAD
jgi:DNA-directed RNA polymerase specialized sigma24 family protein